MMPAIKLFLKKKEKINPIINANSRAYAIVISISTRGWINRRSNDLTKFVFRFSFLTMANR
jgi:hypothetical protein